MGCSDGDRVGEVEGVLLGDAVGLAVGDLEGDVDGVLVGLAVGCALGDFVGDALGVFVGDLEGDFVGEELGFDVGDLLGVSVGDAVGFAVGDFVGEALGFVVGDLLGDGDGFIVGDHVGFAVGASQISLVKLFHSARFPADSKFASVIGVSDSTLSASPCGTRHWCEPLLTEKFCAVFAGTKLATRMSIERWRVELRHKSMEASQRSLIKQFSITITLRTRGLTADAFSN